MKPSAGWVVGASRSARRSQRGRGRGRERETHCISSTARTKVRDELFGQLLVVAAEPLADAHRHEPHGLLLHGAIADEDAEPPLEDLVDRLPVGQEARRVVPHRALLGLGVSVRAEGARRLRAGDVFDSRHADVLEPEGRRDPLDVACE